MKKLLSVLALILFMGTQVQAQDIFNTIFEDAKKVANDPKSNVTLAKIARFKYYALDYTKRKSFEGQGEVTKKFLNDQAYFMSEFINTFFRSALLNETLTKSEKKKIIMLFIDASGSNPLYNDPDKELVNAYVETDGQLTPFCLDTDWPKAYAAVMSKLKPKK